MRFSFIFCALAFLLTGLVAGTAAAQSNAGSVFEVPMVPVRAEADNASTAQAAARNEGRRRAMDILLRRLTAEEDWIYLPQLVYGRAAPVLGGPHADGDDGLIERQRSFSGKDAVALDPSQLPSMEEGFSTFDEKSSARTYSAKITYRFKADAVRNLLKNAGIPYSESQTRMALIIPVLETRNGTYLWETNNPWARAWLARSLTNELTPMLLPRGDETDMALLPVEQALAFDQRSLREMAERYGVNQVLIAHAFLHEEDEQYLLRTRLLDGYLAQSGREAVNYSAQNASSLYDDTAGFGSEGTLIRTAGERPGRVLLENFYRDRIGDFPALAERAVENSVTKYASGWKAQTLVDHSVTRELRVNAWFDTLDEMARIRAALDASPIVENFEVQVSSSRGGTMTIYVVGEIEQLVADLRQRGIIFWSDNGMSWNIATPEKAEEVRGPRRVGNNASDMSLGDPQAGGDFSPPLEREVRQRRLRDTQTPRDLVNDPDDRRDDAD